MVQIIKAGGAGGQGKSAYEIALENEFVGTEVEWLASLKGAKGDTGAKGLKGDNGTAGATGATGLTGANGKDGVSITGLELTKSADGAITGGKATLSDGSTTPITVELGVE